MMMRMVGTFIMVSVFATILMVTAALSAPVDVDEFAKVISKAQRHFRFEISGYHGLAAVSKPRLIESVMDYDYVTMMEDPKFQATLQEALEMVEQYVDENADVLTYRDALGYTSATFDIAPQGVAVTVSWPLGLRFERYLIIEARMYSASEQVDVELYVQEHP